MNIKGIEIDDFTKEALEALFWTEEDQTEGLSEKTVFDIEENSLKMFFDRCTKFQEENAELLEIMEVHNGHNYLLSCNGHGSGFFDEFTLYKGLDIEIVSEIEDAGNKLQEKCHFEKPFYIFIGEDEKVYIESI